MKKTTRQEDEYLDEAYDRARDDEATARDEAYDAMTKEITAKVEAGLKANIPNADRQPDGIIINKAEWNAMQLAILDTRKQLATLHAELTNHLRTMKCRAKSVKS